MHQTLNTRKHTSKSTPTHALLLLQYAKIVQKLGFPATFKEFKVQNIVGSCDVKFPIRLEGLAFGHQLFTHVSENPVLCTHKLL